MCGIKTVMVLKDGGLRGWQVTTADLSYETTPNISLYDHRVRLILANNTTESPEELSAVTEGETPPEHLVNLVKAINLALAEGKRFVNADDYLHLPE